jgi:hypothetical protein
MGRVGCFPAAHYLQDGSFGEPEGSGELLGYQLSAQGIGGRRYRLGEIVDSSASFVFT